MSDLFVTDVGRAVARSALMPRTAAYFLDYFRDNLEKFYELLRQTAQIYDEQPERNPALDRLGSDLSFVLFHLCFCSPEYGDDDTEARRFLPYPLGDRRDGDRAIRLERFLAVRPWDREMLAVNGADICTDWILGEPLGVLEQRFDGLRGGMVHEVLRTVSSHLSGLGDILSAACSGTRENPDSANVEWMLADPRRLVVRLIRRIRQISIQSMYGVPEDILWMFDVVDSNGQPLIRRGLAMEFRRRKMRRLDDLLDYGRSDEFLQALQGVGGGRDARLPMDRIRQAASRGRLERTEAQLDRIEKLLPECEDVAIGYFDSYEKEFEEYMERCFRCLDFEIVGRDDSSKKRPRFPDFVIRVEGMVTLVVECKSSPNGKDIALGDATDVGGKSILHGLGEYYMITVCQKYVGTDVPRQIEADANFSVINAEDIALAMAFLKAKRITSNRFVGWLTTPGQPRAEELYFI